jgi:hypothetical protein
MMLHPTTFTVIHVDGSQTDGEVIWPECPGIKLIEECVQPLIDGEPIEQVSVLYRGRRHDMFVSELGHVALTTRPPLPRNETATAIYRRAALERHPERDPEDLPWIAGPAILFDRIVWT